MNIFELAAKISLDDKGFKKGVDAAKKTFSTLGKAAAGTIKVAAKAATETVKLSAKAGTFLAGVGEKTVSAFETAGKAAIDAGGKVQSLGDTVAKVTAGISAAIAAGTAGLVKLSTDQFAEYEQLVGGVETLFKDSAAVVKTYANNAYKTAGLSANEYMSTVTSFSASLLQSLEGDTKVAAEYANQALVDMSDNANKMGSDMSMIQNAYQGFAKQNYTMLDNLKLGYGGTQKEMERLIEDAAKLDDSIDASSLSFGNIVKAIHAVQTEMGITGTTAKEAATTIQGAANMTKSSWKNLLTALAKGNRNYGKELSELIDSAGIYIDNLVPRVENVLGSIYNIIDTRLVKGGDFLVKIFGDAAEAVPAVIGKVQHLVKKTVALIGSKKTDIKAAAVSMFGGLLSGFTETVDNLLPLIGDFLPTAISKFFELKGTLFGVGLDIVGTIAESIGNNSDLIVDSFFGAVDAISASVSKNGGKIAAGGFKLFDAFLDGIITRGPELITGVSKMISDLAKSITKSGTIKKLSTAARSLFDAITSSFSTVVGDLMPLVSDLVPIIAEGIITKYDILLNTGLDVITAIAEGLANNADTLADKAVGVIDKLVEKIGSDSVLGKFLQSGVKIIGAIAGAIIKNLDGLLDSVDDIIDTIVKELGKKETLKGLADGAVSIISSLVNFFADNLGDLGTAAIEIISGLVTAFADTENLKQLKEAVPKIIKGLCDFFVNLTDPEKFGDLLKAAGEIIWALCEGLARSLDDLFVAGATIISNLAIALVDAVGAWFGLEPKKRKAGSGGFTGGYTISKDGTLTPIGGSHRNGLSYVPYDGYIAELHKGERVLTKGEARDYKAGGSGLVVNVTVNGARYSDEESLAEAVAEKIQEKIERERAVYA
jgi:phage-related protein